MASNSKYQKLESSSHDVENGSKSMHFSDDIGNPQTPERSPPPYMPHVDTFDMDDELEGLDVTGTQASDAFDIESIIKEFSNKSDMKMAFFNMANSILGAGVIGQPLAFKNCGLLSAIICLVLLTVLVDWTLRLIIINNKLSGRNSYQGTVEHCFGFWGKFTILISQGLFALGGSLAFCVIIGDSIPHVIRSIFASAVESNEVVNFLLSREMLIIFFVTGIAYPLSLVKDISHLAKASGMALVGMVVIVSIVMIRGPMMPAELKGTISPSEWFINGSLFQGISVISFALVCHHNTTFIFDSLKKPTLDRFSRLTHISCFISMIVCGLMGTCGYLTFRSKTKGNILNNFPSNDWVANIARFCFGLNMLTTLPLEVFVVRDVIFDLMKLYKAKSTSSSVTVNLSPDGAYQVAPSEEEEPKELSNKAHIIITTVLVFSAEGVALMTCNLGAILELVGSTSACVMAYILPPACFLKMTYRGKSFRENLPSYFCIAFGFAVMIISSTQTILSAINDESDGHCVA